jgi:hypothetical protein
MKLKEWAEKQGISYLTAWRWFKAGDPRLTNAYQSDSGTIIVPDEFEAVEQTMDTVQSGDIMSLVLKKTVEFSNNSTVADFAAWILSNFTLKLKSVSDSPRYSKNKPKSEDVQNHFKQYLKPKGDKPKPNMFVAEPEALDALIAKADDLTAQELVDEIHKIGAEAGAHINPTDAPEVEELMKDLSSALNSERLISLDSSVTTYDDIAEGIVTRSVDLTSQQLNYSGSSGSAFSNVFYSAANPDHLTGSPLYGSTALSNNVSATSNFKPTQKEMQLISRANELADKPKKGRKPSKGK